MTPEPLVSLPLTEALARLCGRGLARDLWEADRRLEKLRAQAAAAGGQTPVGRSSEKSLQAEIAGADFNQLAANSALQCDLAARIRRGEFHLHGRRRPVTACDPSIVLSIADADSVTFTPLFNTIELNGESYDDVEAVFGPVPIHDVAEPRRLPLLQALSHWSSPWTLLNIRRSEAYFRTDEIRAFGLPTLSGTSRAKSAEQGLSPKQHVEGQRLLETLWAELGKDLQSRIAGREIYLTGVQTRPAVMTTQQLIPTTWAYDLRFNFDVMSVTAHGHRWTAVECWLDPPDIGSDPAERAISDPATPAPPATLQPEDVAGLTDEAILTLLEEHAKRVVEGPDAKLIAPGKISLLPIVKRKMEYRAKQGALMPKIADEAEVLADWIALKVKSHAVPTASTIAKVLSGTYAALKARSTAAIQNSGD
ncbi:hypothetical protein [Muricoccus vinaceus]|uniref:Uncharacterized protein n=1 Tax=Muricoccus vinaceus TaxID=424704 RepID=A0ABV6IT81_9PROT